MAELHEIGKRSNINHVSTTHAEAVIYEDHRTILNVLYFLKINRRIDGPIDIFLFDRHDDGCHPNLEGLPEVGKFLDEGLSAEEFWTFVEFKLSHLDDDWVKVGMELGLINNCFLFNAQESDIQFKEEYTTQRFGAKKTYNLGKVWSALGFRGYLDDRIKKKDYGELWDDIGWLYNDTTHKFEFNPRNKFVLDFDLDCFTVDVLEKTIAIPEDIFFNKFRSCIRPTYHYYYSAEYFIKELIRKSELVTICFESGCCGGYRECFKVFQMVDELFFENELGG